MKVIGIMGSPRRDKNTETLMKEMLEGAKSAGAETEIFYPNELNIKGCQACYACNKTGVCIQKDDMKKIYDAIAESDAIVFGTPMYMWKMTAQLKLVVDRLFSYFKPDFTSHLPKGKKTALIFTQAAPDKEMYKPYFESVADVLKQLGFERPESIVSAICPDDEAVSKDIMLLENTRIAGRKLVA